jgi:hypothetical protein
MDELLSSFAFNFSLRQYMRLRPRRPNAVRGGVVQVDPMQSGLKAPGSHLLTLKHDELLSSFAFKCKLRGYDEVFANALFTTPG